VTLTPLPVAVTSVPAPTGLQEIAQRMPGGASRVRVERYTMTDGSRQFAVYVAGTRSAAVGGADPWDQRSNAELYVGRASASYEATEAALAAAGARPGDVVHAFGHSQGAMITAHLALEGGYDTRTLVAFGSPVEADVGSATLSVAVRHTDDPVVAGAGGGHIAPVGSPGSFVVEREFDPESGPHDAALPAHHMSAYAQTASMADASGDPRVAGIRGALSELSGAVEVEVTEYAATRDEG
jgi:pimeloyl-ACP methyl ester carboxylesterase